MSTRAGAQQIVQAVDDTAFSFVCVGVSGGPFETDCSSYVMKLADKKWSEGITLLEAGEYSKCSDRFMAWCTEKHIK